MDYSIFTNGRIEISGPKENECNRVFIRLREKLVKLDRSWSSIIGKKLELKKVRLETEVTSIENKIVTEAISNGVKDNWPRAQIQEARFHFVGKEPSLDTVTVYLQSKETTGTVSFLLAIQVEASTERMASSIMNSLKRKLTT